MRFILRALTILIVAFSAHAEVALDTKKLCNASVPKASIDKEMLAAEILDVNEIPRTYTASLKFRKPGPYVDWLKANGLPSTDLAANTYLLEMGDGACAVLTESLCKKEAGKKLGGARSMMGNFLRGTTKHFTVTPTTTSAVSFFSDATIEARCTDIEPEAAAPADVETQDPDRRPWEVRVRGSADDLDVRRTGHPGSFKTLDRATFSLSQDDENDERVRKISGVVGVAIPVVDRPLVAFPDWKGTMDLVPYVGISSDIAKAAGSDATVAENTRLLGVALEGYSWRRKGYWWSVRPQWLWNVDDDSRLFTTVLRWRPMLPKKLNSDMGDGGYLNYQWLFDARFNHGQYTSLGTRDPEKARDYDRLGAQVGFSIGHESESFPWQWTVKDTWYYGFTGDNKTLGQFESTFSYSFGELELFGIDLTYTNGRDGETGERDKSWKVDLGFRY